MHTEDNAKQHCFDLSQQVNAVLEEARRASGRILAEIENVQAAERRIYEMTEEDAHRALGNSLRWASLVKDGGRDFEEGMTELRRDLDRGLRGY